MVKDSLPQPYAEHLTRLLKTAEEALAAGGYDALVIHSGTPFRYFEDDQEAPFRTNPSFAHFLPLEGPHHLLFITPGKTPLLLYVSPQDYWYEYGPLEEPFWKKEFEVREVGSAEDAWKELPRSGRLAFIGDKSTAIAGGMADDSINPARVLARLYWQRSFKTPYEILCIDEANHLAAHAHERAREAFLAGASELEIHESFLEQLGTVESALPYGTIVALNEKSAILHYQNKRLVEDGKVLLLDAGASYMGYAADITRTFLSEDCDVLFAGLVGGVDTLQRELGEMAKPGVSFPELHHAAHVKIGDLLHSLSIIHISGEDAAHEGVTRAFFPHGLGHFLGIQVHDVGGNQKNAAGEVTSAPEAYPKLRMTRSIEQGNVFTIEPGVYFIPMLLKKEKESRRSALFNWELIDRLTPLGGVRIEDDIVATSDGNHNLTRQYILIDCYESAS